MHGSCGEKGKGMIITQPKELDTFSRCETDYSLLELHGGRFAIEWRPWHDSPYAILYDDLHKAAADFNALRMSKISYISLEDKTDPDNILQECPWREEGTEALSITRMGEGFWNILFDHDGFEVMRIGPYDRLGEAVGRLPEDILNLIMDEEE
jgi:hypothetical protein